MLCYVDTKLRKFFVVIVIALAAVESLVANPIVANTADSELVTNKPEFVSQHSESIGNRNSLLEEVSASIEKSSNNPHHRMKRQYFKPTMDGSWFSNERKVLLKSVRNGESGSTSNGVIVSTSAVSEPSSSSNPVISNSVPNADNPKNAYILDQPASAKGEVTVASLSISLISLFDRIRATLCGLVNNCAS